MSSGKSGDGTTGNGAPGPGMTGPGMTGPGMTGPGMTGPGMTGPGMTGPGMTGNDTFGIDHPLVTVRDLDATCRAWEAMGFSPSPRGFHPWGTANNLVVFPHDFVELIGIHDPAKVGRATTSDGFSFSGYVARFLERREGISMVALHSKDAPGDAATLNRRGLDCQGLTDFRRAVTLPDGTADEAVVTLAMLIEDEAPFVSNFICHQHKPELVWVPAWQHHANGCDGILEVTYLSDHPGRLADRWVRLYSGNAVRVEADRIEARTPNGRLVGLHPESFAARFPGITTRPADADLPCGVALRLHTRDVRAARSCLGAGGVPHIVAAHGTLRIPPEATGGVILELAAD